MIRLLFLFMCYTQFILVMGLEPVTYKRCRTENECVLLKDCKSYMNFVNSLEKPLKPSVVEFLREKQCGFEGDFPKVCCSDVSKNTATALSQANYKSCNKEIDCVPVKDCKPYMDLINKMEKPLKPLVVEFLRVRQCGLRENYPLVCCSLLPKNVLHTILKHASPDSRPHVTKKLNKLSSTEFGLRDIFSKVQTTTNPSVFVRDKKVKEISEAMNKEFDLSDFFDFTGSFDLFRRKRFNNGTLDIEIR